MKYIRVGLAQINPIVGDFDYNLNKILEFIDLAKKKEVDLIAFPELALTGYPPEDLLFKPSFIEKNLYYLDKLKEKVQDIIVIVGFVDKDEDIYNAAAVIYNKKIVAKYHKQFLPNYGVFDENRYFQKGNSLTVLKVDNKKIGLSICEDIWYPENPVNYYSLLGVSLVININASPYSEGKIKKREELLKVRARDNLLSIAYVNMVGGQDELVFDGNSFILSPTGTVFAKGLSFEEDLVIADIDLDEVFRVQLKDGRLKNLRSLDKDIKYELVEIDYKQKEKKQNFEGKIILDKPDIENTYQALVLGLRDYIVKNGFKKVVIGLSGGIDSSLVACIAVDALGSENVKGVLMPSPYTSKESIEDALELAKNLNIETFTIPITDIFNTYLKEFENVFTGLKPDITEENLQARIRGNILMALSNKLGWIVLATGNKSEMSVGYSTLYGDMVGGFAILKDVLKTKVYELSRYRNSISKVIPNRVFIKPPSAELKPNQTDEAELLPYDILDEIIKMYVEEDLSLEEIVNYGFNKDDVIRIIKLIDRNEYKRRQAPIGLKITERAFGKDRRMPITSRFQE